MPRFILLQQSTISRLMLIIIIISERSLKSELAKCACAKTGSPVFILNESDQDNDDTKVETIKPGRCLLQNIQQTKFWVGVEYNNQSALVHRYQVILIDCINDSISFSSLVMNQIYECSDWKHRLQVFASYNALPHGNSTEFLQDLKDQPLSSLKKFLDDEEIFVSIYIDSSLGISYGNTICIPELNRMFGRLIIFRVANTYGRHELPIVSEEVRLVFDDGGVPIGRPWLTLVY